MPSFLHGFESQISFAENGNRIQQDKDTKMEVIIFSL